MRSAILTACLLATALAGCVDPIGDQIYAEGDPTGAGTNQTAPPTTEAAAAGETPVRSAPLITQIATARFTAPGPITLATATDGGITFALVGDHDGLSCVPSSTYDPMAAPAGYRVDRLWVACSLAADNTTFARQTSEDLTSAIPLMLDIPVDHFAWSYEVGRVLVNNSGEHEQLLFNGTERLLAAPDFHIHAMPDGYVQACDSRWDSPEYPEGVETLTWTVEAIRGLASIEVDAAGQRVLEATSSHGNVTHLNGTSLYRADGQWGDDTVTLSLTIDFEGEGASLFLIPGCGGLALTADFVELVADIQVVGIAAGWSAGESIATPVEVFVTEF